jgi:hypothetical protein
MMRRACIFIVLVLLLATTWLAQTRAAAARHDVLLLADKEGGTVIPGTMLKMISLGFEGLMADHLFLRCLTFSGRLQEDSQFENGGKVIKEGLSLDNPRRWDWFTAQLHAVTDLDPYFFDPYFIGYNNLVWTAKRYAEANLLLDKGIAARDWDWNLPFNAGFTAFYFLDDKQAGASYLMTASSRPDAPPLLATLAARLAYEENQTANAIIFLQQQIRDAEKSGAETRLQRERLDALKAVYSIEQAVAEFRAERGRYPGDIAELLESGFLKNEPKDPYGGRFYLEADGRVKTTSDLGRERG